MIRNVVLRMLCVFGGVFVLRIFVVGGGESGFFALVVAGDEWWCVVFVMGFNCCRSHEGGFGIILLVVFWLDLCCFVCSCVE